MVSVDHRWQIKAEPGQISWPNTLSLQISRLRCGAETGSPAISPCVWAPFSDPHGSGAWPSLALSLGCSKETSWPRARRLKGRSCHSRFLSGTISCTLCPYRHSCLSQTLGPQEAEPSNIWGHFPSLRASPLVFSLELKQVCPGPQEGGVRLYKGSVL